VIISPGNHLTASLNDIKNIFSLCHKYKAPLFSNYRYFFGFVPIIGDCWVCETDKESILSISYALLSGYKLDKYAPLLKNESNKNMLSSMLSFGKKMQAKRTILSNFRTEIIDKLGAVYYEDFVKMKVNDKRNKINVVVFGAKNSYAPNIISLLFIKKNKKSFSGSKNQPKKEFKLLGINEKWYTHIQVYLLDNATKKDINDIIHYK
jgi:hypothetical protein